MALRLYRYNVKLSQKCYGILNNFEVLLRNSIDCHYKTYFSDPDWIRNQLSRGGMLEFHPQRKEVESIIAHLLKTDHYSNDKVVSSVSFGFWTYMFTKIPFQRGGKSILKIFPAKELGVGQRVVYNELQAIKSFRNRIAHHETICFDNSGIKSTQIARYNLDLIFKYIEYFGYRVNQFYYGFDIIPNNLFKAIDTM